MADTKVTGAQSTPAFIERLDVFSNKDQSKTVSIVNGTMQLMYYESLLQDSVMATVTFADSGNSIDKKSALEGLPIVGTEKVIFKIKDNNEEQIEFTFYVNKVTPVGDQTTKGLVNLHLVSKEYILNEKIRVTKRMDGKVSDHIRTILTSQDYLKTEKKVDIEDTINNFNFFGNNKKSFYTINWLSKKGVSAKSQKLGTSAGYFFYETSEGFFFKSIDSLLDQEPKTKMIYNETPDTRGSNIPEGYDQKILRFQKSNAVNVQEKLKMGSYSNRIVLFDPFTCFYEVKTNDTDRTQGSLKKGGKELSLSDSRNKEFDIPGNNKEFSRTQYFLLDKGTAPTGNADQQIEKSGEENFEYGQIANQSMMRYNQLYAMRASITIAGNFSLHAGDAIFIDSPGLQKKNTAEVDRRDGGLYIITDICHKIDGTGTYTQCNLARDSFGRKPITR